MKNEVIYDGFLYQDAKVYSKLISLTVNARTHSVKQENGTYKSAYTSMKVNYFGEQSQKLLDHLKKGAPVRITGKLDTESFDGKDGKKIYRVILIANSITKINFEKTTKDGKEVTVVTEEVLV